MGFLHHSNYLSYFEIGRTELFRAQGGSYRRLEALGLYLVVVNVNVRYRKPARYDDVLQVETTLTRTTPAKLEHRYRVFRDSELLTEGESTIACINGEGQVQRMPEDLVS
ncbi:MAG: acyl-CoA thioesterase, partial [Phycisphaerae bacterium]